MEEFTGSHWDILFWTFCTFVSWTHFKWVSSKPEREKPQHCLHGLLLVWAERDARGWAGGATQILWGSGAAVGQEMALGLSGACLQWRKCCLSSPLQPKHSTTSTTLQPQGESGAQLWSSCSPLWAESPGFCPGCHLQLAGVCNVSSPHMCVKLYSFLYSKGKPFQPSEITFSRHCCLHFPMSTLTDDTGSTKMQVLMSSSFLYCYFYLFL